MLALLQKLTTVLLISIFVETSNQNQEKGKKIKDDWLTQLSANRMLSTAQLESFHGCGQADIAGHTSSGVQQLKGLDCL